jgi:hypothetical protein
MLCHNCTGAYTHTTASTASYTVRIQAFMLAHIVVAIPAVDLAAEAVV